MRILHISSEHPPQQVFGLGRYVCDLSRELAAQGHHVHVLTNSMGGTDQEIIVENVFLHRADFPPPPKPPDPVAPAMAFNLHLLQRATAHDLAFERHPEFFSAGLLALLKREIRRSISSAEGIIAISEATRTQLLEVYNVPKERTDVIYQGLRPIFHPNNESAASTFARLNLDRPYILMLSNHAPHKNTAFGLAVFALWLKLTNNRKHDLVIAGGGPAPNATADLRSVIGEYQLESRVKCVGQVDEAILPALYAGADVFLFPSLFEGWGLPPLEAMCMGTPSIVSDRGGLPEAVGDAACVLSLDDPNLWAENLIALTKDGPTVELKDRMVRRVAELRKASGDALREALKKAIRTFQSRAIPAITRTSISNSDERAINLSGCMVIKNGLRLGYPFIESILSVIDFVDEMVIVDGASTDGTWQVLAEMAQVCSKIALRSEPWPSITKGGEAIASATNSAMRLCRGSHVLYVQADEIHTASNLKNLTHLLLKGYDSAAFPFLHFRTSWWKVTLNPAYVASVRCVPNRAGVRCVGDGVTFDGPLQQCAMPNEFADPIFHVGWVYSKNILEKHQNHAGLYADNPEYIKKSQQASRSAGGQCNLAAIDSEYKLGQFAGDHPNVLKHLLELPQYDHSEGLRLWRQKFSN